MSTKSLIRVIIIVSIAIPVVVGVLLFSPVKIEVAGEQFKILPHINAVINSFTAVFLILGYFFIRKRNERMHRFSMLTAFLLGSIFLVSYVVYHSTVPSTSFGGEGVIRNIYFFLLLSHILLSIVVVPFVLFALYFAFTANWIRHVKTVKYTLPIWLYVSVSGVLVYLMISPYYS